jgi:O-antigen/teichoic acid export membrane protein
MRHDLELRRFAADSVINLVRLGGAAVLGLLLSALLARALGTQGKGLYELALVLPLIIQSVFNVGVVMSAAYYVAHGDHDVVTAARGSITLSLWLSAGGLIIGAALVYLAGTALFPGVPSDLLYFSLILLPLLYLRLHLGAVLQGLQDFRSFGLVELTPPFVTLVLIVPLIFVWNGGVVAALAATLVGSAAGCGLALLLLRRRMAAHTPLVTLRLDHTYWRQMIGYGLKAQINLIAVYLLLRMDVLLLNLWGTGGTASVGIYSIAVLLAERIWTFSTITGQIILPRIASWAGDEDRRTQLTLLNTRLIVWFGVLLLAALALLGEWFIVLLYGEAFRAAAEPLLWLLPGIFLFNLARVLGPDIAGRGHIGINAVIAAVAFVINLAANAVLIPRFDYNGAALATSMAYAFLGVASVIAFCRISGAHWWQTWLFTRADLALLQRAFRHLQAMSSR